MITEEVICRACLYNNESSNWKNSAENFNSLKSTYKELTELEVSDDDGLPQLLCSSCCTFLEKFKTFKRTCIDSYESLKKTVLFVKSEEDWIDVPVEIKIETQEDPPTIDLESKDDGNESKKIAKVKRKRHSIADEDTEDEPNPTTVNANVNRKSLFSYRCDIEGCTRGFRKKLSLEAHKRVHSGKDPFACDLCEKELSSIKSMLRHRKTHTAGKAVVNKDEDSDDSDDEKPLVQNLRKKCKLGQGKYAFTHKCTVKGCRRSFRSQLSLDAHLRIHQGDKPGVCDICEKPLASMRTMKKHRLTHMSIENRSFECKVCFKFYVSEMALKVHQREHSDSGRSFICDVCGLGYHSTSVLNNHKKTHSAEPTYKCDQCPKAYRNRNVLYNHKKLYHERRNEVHKCRICDKVYATKKSIWSHYRNVHTVYTTKDNIFPCFQCGAKLKSLTCLQRHVKLHEGERNYACPDCPKTFAHAAVLKRHSYFHSGNWPVHCEICKKGFYEKRDMQVHMNIHKRQMIAEGAEGVCLFNRNKKKIETVTSDVMTNYEHMGGDERWY